jgi:hypothetical protein
MTKEKSPYASRGLQLTRLIKTSVDTATRGVLLMRERTECASELKERSYSARVAGKYLCSRCGRTPRNNSPDPPRACARCRSAYWQSTSASCRANSPSEPKWRAESQSVAKRKQRRHLTRLKELAAAFGFALPPARGDLGLGPVFPLPQDSSQPAELRLNINEPVPSGQGSVPAPRRSLVEELCRRMAADANVAAPE